MLSAVIRDQIREVRRAAELLIEKHTEAVYVRPAGQTAGDDAPLAHELEEVLEAIRVGEVCRRDLVLGCRHRNALGIVKMPGAAIREDRPAAALPFGVVHDGDGNFRIQCARPTAHLYIPPLASAREHTIVRTRSANLVRFRAYVVLAVPKTSEQRQDNPVACIQFVAGRTAAPLSQIEAHAIQLAFKVATAHGTPPARIARQVRRCVAYLLVCGLCRRHEPEVTQSALGLRT
jgi:hypothetical protein